VGADRQVDRMFLPISAHRQADPDPVRPFTTLEAICAALDCRPVNLIEYRPSETDLA
jgi:hypothetical protein